MNTILDIIIFVVVLFGAWLLALELRFHSLKSFAAESQQLAEEGKQLAADAADEAEALFQKVRAELAAEKKAKPKATKRP